MKPSPRRNIYYWKCDRDAAFHGTEERSQSSNLQELLHAELLRHFDDPRLELRPGHGQGNHLTFHALINNMPAFIRVEDGPEGDDYLEVESHLLNEVRSLAIAAPRVLAVDATRERVPFAWQALEFIPYSDLNRWQKQGVLEEETALFQIGAAVARWQGLQPAGFGPFDTEALRRNHVLQGYHPTYAEYFQLQLDRHLCFLRDHDFLSQTEADEIAREISAHAGLLAFGQGCLVHKDLALWNVLGTASQISAFIDWDDAISGDPMDDLALLACFHHGPPMARALEGYQSLRQLPPDYRRRFWLHLLRNMIVKAVIRVGAGYFERSDSFFLIGAGSTGGELKKFTQARLRAALDGLREDSPIDTL